MRWTEAANKKKPLQPDLRQLELLYRTTPVGLCLLDRELRFVRVNDRLAEMNGKPVEEHIGKTVREILPEFADLAEELRNQICRTGEPILNREVERETATVPGVRRTWIESWWPLKDKDGKKIVGISVVVNEVTELKRMQEELQALNETLERRVQERTRQLGESRERYRQRIDSIPHMVWSMLSDGSGEYCDRQTLDYLGMTLERMRQWDWTEALHPEDRERVTEEFAEMLRTGEEGRSEMRIRRAHDGRYRWHSVHVVPIFDDERRILRWLGTCTDRHDRRQAEEGFRQMSRIFQDAAVPILLEDDQGRVLDMNEEAERVLGWSGGELRGMSLKTILHSEWYEGYDRSLERCRKGESVRNQEMVLLARSGERIPVLLTLSALSGEAEDGTACTAVIAKDISRIKRTEEALRASERSLQEEKTKLVDKNITLREILEQVEREKAKIREEVALHLQESVLPVLERLAEQGDNPSLMAMLRMTLEDLSSPRGRRLSEGTARLTAREKEVCRLLKAGLASKEISQILNCSPQTVEKHRKNIRKKLGIVGTGTHLGAYLNEG